jgi:1-deoxy-D-xylulose-5-phosphate reductoisomerase
MKHLAILGSTGSIGQSALDVVRAHPERLRVVGLAGGSNAARFRDQAIEFTPKVIAMSSDAALQGVTSGYAAEQAGSGSAGMIAVATHPDVDIVICASSGTAGLEAVLAAIEAGKTIALANKEVLVMAGSLVMAAARKHGVAILPVDSEHNAIHQCLHGRRSEEIRRVILTASGGPFRESSAASLEGVKPEDALRHPTWRMGRKITIDSATLMNKGLEVIEAHWLFDLPASQIDVVIHPQSVVHSMVELNDGSIIAQLGGADMKLPIQYACSYPERWDAPVARLDLTAVGRLEFHSPDFQRFRCLRLAYRALEAGPSHAVVLNAANEVAVASYLDEKISFTSIPRLIEQALDAHTAAAVNTLDEVRGVDAWARLYSQKVARELELKV